MISRLAQASLVLSWLLVSPQASDAQTAASTPTPQSGYTLQTNTRVVLTDVTVTDQKGNPVRGLTVNDFRVFDNGKPQQIASFEEHFRDDAVPKPQPAALPGTYSNDYLEHPPQALNIILLDLTNVSIEDQMWLRYQLGKFFDLLSPATPVAIYARTGGASLLLQSFTSDRDALRNAVKKIMPRFPPPGGEYLTDFQTLSQIEAYVGEMPGRKNVLWFSGGSTLFLRPDGSIFNTQGAWREIYDELEEKRIAIYPIDARGLTIVGGQMMLAQHGLMSDVAQATGGQATYDSNGVAAAATRIVNDDGDYYTLTYTPQNFHFDRKWHKVRVETPEASYRLSYRRGYFGDPTSDSKPQPNRTRTRLLNHGKTVEELPSNHASIIFHASIRQGGASLPAGTPAMKQPRGTKPYTVLYSVPLDALTRNLTNGRATVACDVAVVAFNANGTMIAHRAQQDTFTLTESAYNQPGGKSLPVELEIPLPKGDAYLLVAVWDAVSKRLGTLEIPHYAESAKDSMKAASH